VELDIVPEVSLDRRAAMLATPALVKAYLRLGGRAGQGAFLDPGFGCLDVCMVLDTATLSARARAIYGGERA
jgi:putative hemolysin